MMKRCTLPTARPMCGPHRSLVWAVALLLSTTLPAPSAVAAQTAKVRDLTIPEGEVPVRLVGYGIITGLDGTGDRAYGGRDGSMTVRSIANLLRNLGIEVPERVIRTRNSAAVLVTAEASPYTRRGGRFDVSVASIGDATSLRGGQLWQTPLLTSVGGPPMGVVQGNLLFAGRPNNARGGQVETSAVLSDAGVALADLGSASTGPPGRLLLKRPDLATAQTIALAINAALGGDVATVEDPGSVALQLPADDPITALVALGDVDVTPTGRPVVVIDAKSGAVAAGGEISVGLAVVSHEWLTLTIGADAPPPAGGGAPGIPGAAGALPPGAVRAETGIRVQSLAEALHAVGATADVISAVFRSLKSVGALQAEVQVR